MASEAALQLDVEPTDGAGVEVHFSNFPGVWQAGRPIAVTALGFHSLDEALAAVDDAGVPLHHVEVEHGSAPLPPRENHVASEEQAHAVELATAASAGAFKTHAAADQAAAAAGVEWPRPKMTVAEKTEFLASFEAGETDETGTDETGGEA